MRKLSSLGLILGIAITFLLISIFCQKEQSSSRIYKKREDMKIKTENNVESKEEKKAEENKKEVDWLVTVIDKNQRVIEEYLMDFPAEIKWIDVSFFDFTKDGKKK